VVGGWAGRWWAGGRDAGRRAGRTLVAGRWRTAGWAGRWWVAGQRRAGWRQVGLWGGWDSRVGAAFECGMNNRAPHDAPEVSEGHSGLWVHVLYLKRLLEA
jgi:hypothetical protein